MVQSCVVGRECDPDELCEVLRVSGFDVIVVIETSAVEKMDKVNGFLLDTLQAQARMRANDEQVPTFLKSLLKEKAVHQATDKIYIFVHRGKVSSWTYTAWDSTAVAEPELLQFGSLHVDFYVHRQRVAHFRLGIVEIWRWLDEPALQALQAWIETDTVAAVTGWWGCGNEEQVGKLAERCKSTWSTPLYNDFVFEVKSPTNWTTCTYFLLFGKCFSVTWPEQPSVVPRDFHFGDDIRHLLRPVANMPWWPRGESRPDVQNLGKVNMKQIAWKTSPQCCFQTSLWLGESVPSVRSQIRQEKGKGKRKFR